MEAIHDNKENQPPVSSSANQIDPKPAHVWPRLKKSAVVGKGIMAREPLADVTHLFIGGSALTRSSSARASSGLSASVLHLPTPCPKKRRALDDVDLLRAAARPAKSLRMGFR